MAKPIFIVKYPIERTPEVIGKASAQIRNSMNDYHVLFVPIESVNFQFECYNSEEANDIDFTLLQERVIELTKMAVA
jgi:hypothetical protein